MIDDPLLRLTEQGERDRETWEASLRQRAATHRSKRNAVSHRDIDNLMEGVSIALASFVKQKLAPLMQRIEQLEQRPAVKHCGVYAEGTEYAEANLVTDRGGLWLAERTTQARPGADASGWRLIVKRGEAVLDADGEPERRTGRSHRGRR